MSKKKHQSTDAGGKKKKSGNPNQGIDNLIKLLNNNKKINQTNIIEVLQYLGEYQKILNKQNELIRGLKKTKLQNNLFIGGTDDINREAVLDKMKRRQEAIMNSIQTPQYVQQIHKNDLPVELDLPKVPSHIPQLPKTEPTNPKLVLPKAPTHSPTHKNYPNVNPDDKTTDDGDKNLPDTGDIGTNQPDTGDIGTNPPDTDDGGTNQPGDGGTNPPGTDDGGTNQPGDGDKNPPGTGDTGKQTDTGDGNTTLANINPDGNTTHDGNENYSPLVNLKPKNIKHSKNDFEDNATDLDNLDTDNDGIGNAGHSSDGITKNDSPFLNLKKRNNISRNNNFENDATELEIIDNRSVVPGARRGLGPTGPGGLGPTGPGGLGPLGPDGVNTSPDAFYQRNNRGVNISENLTSVNNSSNTSNNSSNNANSDNNSNSNSNSSNNSNINDNNNNSSNSTSNIFSNNDGITKKNSINQDNNDDNEDNINNNLNNETSSIDFGGFDKQEELNKKIKADNKKKTEEGSEKKNTNKDTLEKKKEELNSNKNINSKNSKEKSNKLLDLLIDNKETKKDRDSISSDILSFSSTSEDFKSFSKIPSINYGNGETNSMDTSSNIFSQIDKKNNKTEKNKKNEGRAEDKKNNINKTEVLEEISEYESSTFNKIKNKIKSLTSSKTNKQEELSNNNNEIIEANDNLTTDNTFKKNENSKIIYEQVEPLIKESNTKMNTLDKKFNQKIELLLDLDYNNLKPDVLIEIINNTLRFMPKNNVIEPKKIQTAGGTIPVNNKYEDLLKLENILELSPKISITKDGDKTKITIDNLSDSDFRKLKKFTNRVEEYVTNRYLDKLEDIDSTQEAIEKYENIKYYKKNVNNDVDFFDGTGRKVTLIQLQNRIINVTRIKNETKIEFCKLLEPIPPEVEKKASFLNHLKSGTSSTLAKIKNSFGKLIPSFDFKFKKDIEDKNELVVDNQPAEPNKVVEEPKEEPVENKPARKRTLKNSYTFHQLPGHRPIKNSTIKITKKRLNSKNNKSKNKKSKENTEKKIKKKVKKQKLAKLVKKKIKREKNHESFHKIRKR